MSEIALLASPFYIELVFSPASESHQIDQTTDQTPWIPGMEAEMSAHKDSDVDLSQGSAFRCLGSADLMDTLSTSGMRDSSMTKDLN